MSTPRTLRGGCQCGRNMYIVQPPPDASEVARLLFDPAPSHRASLASPLPTYLRVPLAWYHSSTIAFFPDETQAMIHRAYEHLLPGAATAISAGTRRHFCGFCGTPLSFWSETPPSEADYIRLALGSLSPQDLDELDEWTGAQIVDGGEGEESSENNDDDDDGNDDNDNDGAQTLRKRAQPGDGPLGHITSLTGIPWFDSLVEGSRLGRHLQRQQRQQQKALREHAARGGGAGAHVRRHDAGSAQSADGTVQVEWEVLEWTEGDDEGGASEGSKATAGARSSEPSPAKRPRMGEDDVPGQKAHGAMEVEE